MTDMNPNEQIIQVKFLDQGVELKTRHRHIVLVDSQYKAVIKPGDFISYYGEYVLWTPKQNRFHICRHIEHETCLKSGIDYDINIATI